MERGGEEGEALSLFSECALKQVAHGKEKKGDMSLLGDSSLHTFFYLPFAAIFIFCNKKKEKAFFSNAFDACFIVLSSVGTSQRARVNARACTRPAAPSTMVFILES